MFKARIGKEEKGILLELLKLMAEIDGIVTQDEMEMILKVKKMYRLVNYKYKNMTVAEVRIALSEMNENNVLNILTHAVLLAMIDDDFNTNEQKMIQSFFDLVSLESALKMQTLIDKYGNQDYDIRDFFLKDKSKEDVIDESLKMLDDFSSGNIDEIDETLLMKMNRGPVKKIWDQVLKIFVAIKDPKTDTAIKALGIGALIYLISPIDAIPDIIPILGLTDDVGVIAYVISKLAKSKSFNK